MVVNATLDAAVFLLLLGAAVVGLTTADAGSQPTLDDGRSDAVANVLATSTATVNYSLSPGARRANESGADFRRTSGPEFERTTHGSLAGLLARVTVGTAGFDGTPVTHARDDFRSSVREAITARLVPTGLRIDAAWRPYPDAPVEGHVAVGASPPQSAATDAATLTIPTRTQSLPANETDDFESLSNAVAAQTIETVAPASRTRLALRGDPPVSTLVRYRYARLAAALNVSVEDPIADADTDVANQRLADALAPRVESDLRARYDSPADAAAAVSVSEVRIVVRTWGDESEGGR
ncbi:hypothetical protein C499_16142 [Halogeometricum borinquense DSM 11551]|uniref:Uncharacterized protein n=1 Tax=Halogeometricum borinquense (strain ATCC 700274 / DSM 11551 / JCM 10706 / KCTC 4070 / PR3) TaxID=469382 RepID=E4NRX3_HALBP|nr:hypothetical protein Hbor_24610 [Halogeometricum borinquense DSM 11551]ELY24060.1 hypothetical protein C499_16142 [Halogeometricum borinquense DSM 11551]